MTVFDFLFAGSPCFMAIYLYDDDTEYLRENTAACYDGLSYIPDFIAEKYVRAYRIDFKSESVHILY